MNCVRRAACDILPGATIRKKRQSLRTKYLPPQVERKIEAMNNEELKPSATETDNRAEQQRESRRRLIRAGIAAGGVMAAAPVMATNTPGVLKACAAPSATLSGAQSHSQAGSCQGQSPGYWQNSSKPNPPGVDRNVATFHSLFIAGGAGKSFYKSNGGTSVQMTLMNVLNLQGNEDLEKVAFHITGAYLNIMAGWVQFPVGGVPNDKNLMIQSIQTIWSEWVQKGYYEPFAGTKWGGTEIKNYLISQGIVG